MGTKLIDQFTRALREGKYYACSDHSLQEGNTISSTNFHWYQTTPPPKMSFSAGEEPLCSWASHWRKGAPLAHLSGTLCMQLSLESLSTGLSMVSVKFFSANPIPNSAIF